MGWLGKVERLVEEAIEGGFGRLLRPVLQPVLLARALEQAMQNGCQVGPRGLEAPNHYRLLVNPADFARLQGYQRRLEQDLAAHLWGVAAERGLHPGGLILVQISPDRRVAPARVRVLAERADPAGAEDASLLPLLEQTRPLSVAAPGRAARAMLESAAGQRFALAGPLTRLGRALDNDLVISDLRVSRYHAQIRQEAGVLTVHDLGSTNGTFVDGERVTSAPLRAGAELSLGGYILLVRAGLNE